VESEAYDQCRTLLRAHPDLRGLYITTEASIPVIEAARNSGMLEKLTIVTTDIFPSLVQQMKSGAVLAPIYQRPHTQGRMASGFYTNFWCGEYAPLCR
jgi:LacI family transcriptional regulator